MFHLKYFFYCILLHLIVATPQINLYNTDWIHNSETQIDNQLQHNCLHFNFNFETVNRGETIYYCMSELPSKFHIEDNDLFSKFTFDDLSNENISSQQLYLWSAPIDLIERYQFYLNQSSTLNDSSLGKQLYYNCTWPRFGPKCQYELYYHRPQHSSLFDIITDFYQIYQYNPTTFTCYIHLKCNRGPFPSCLDWTEICDRQINCLDGGFDEEHCWQLEINQCTDDEYQCNNGQCIPKSLYKDDISVPDCIDASDASLSSLVFREDCYKFKPPSFKCEDTKCSHTSLTSSCVKSRKTLLLEAMYSFKNSSVSTDCWPAFKCIMKLLDSDVFLCNELCKQNACIQIVKNNCPDNLYFQNISTSFGEIYFVYRKYNFEYLINSPYASLYMCYNNSYYNYYFVNVPKILLDNLNCVHYDWFLSQLHKPSDSLDLAYELLNRDYSSISNLYRILSGYYSSFNYTSAICNQSNMYQCIHSSKCISIRRIMDMINDCPHLDDENMMVINNTNEIERIKESYFFKCERSNKYIPPSSVQNSKCDCQYNGWCEDEDLYISYIQTTVLFQHICDGFIDLFPVLIEGRYETDETECEQWECNNIYTRCNGVWNCHDGRDESDCTSSSQFDCASKHHLCVSPHTNQFMCLTIEKANDGTVDCLGATDEPKLCGTNPQTTSGFDNFDYFYCVNQSSQSCIDNSYLCDGNNDCEHGDDEQFCTKNRTTPTDNGICWMDLYDDVSNVEKFLCKYRLPTRNWGIIHFTLGKITDFLSDPSNNIKNAIFSSVSTVERSDQYFPRCHRGLDLRVWLNNKSAANTCLCPQNYYGNICQYQNQRISLTIIFHALSDSYLTPIAIVISLIDDSEQRIVHSYEHLTFLSLRNCKTKFHIPLIYSTRPKNPEKNYAIHIDFYEKLSFIYRGSVWLPIYFPFLPVHRLSFIVNVPPTYDNAQSCFNEQCIHGKCIKYSNNPSNLTFCKCDKEWSGKYCNIQHNCTCASDSLCIGISSNNRSICICPINKFGPRCLITDIRCQTNDSSICQNGGQCMSDENYRSPNEMLTCICPKRFYGDRCQFTDNKLNLSFDKDIILSQSIFIHFIEVRGNSEPIRGSTFRTIPVRQDSITIYWSRPFHLVFIEIFNQYYYLIVVQKIYNQTKTINKTIKSSDRCPNISELFNESFIKWDLIRRIKSYHFPCQNQSLNLSCFYDEAYFCLCNDFHQKRLANCFKFIHNMTFNCSGNSVCENGAQCLQDEPECPQKSICMCPSCYYGIKCQFSTSGFGLSLDAILGYHILPNISFNHQPSIIKTSLASVIIFITAGLVNSILSMITFKNKIVRAIGCGIYLLCSSIITLLIMIMLGFKFSILILSQMTIISNRSFLLFQCHSIDFVLRICVNMDQWLHACIATERAITIIKGTRFVKKQSKRAAKIVIIVLLIIIIGTSIHDPISRRLIDEESNDDDNFTRTWCIVSYRPALQVYDYIIQTFHFLAPFLVNFISAVILIKRKSRQQSTIQTQQNYTEILRAQFQEHKNLLAAPVVLIILSVPRLILVFVSKCMKSTSDSWLFLIGYLITIIPSMMTFIIFILPSKFYKEEFHKSVYQVRSIVQRRLHLRS